MFLYRTRGVFWMVWLVWKWCESYAMAFNGRCNVFDSALHHHHQNIFGRWAFSSVADAQRAFRLISRWANKRTQKGKLSTHLFSTAYHSLILHISITKPCGWSILVFKPQKQHRCLFELHQKRLHCFFFVFLKLWWWNIWTVMRLFDCQGVRYELPMVLVCSRGSAVSTGSVALEGRPAPALLTARTLNWYRAPSFRPNTG